MASQNPPLLPPEDSSTSQSIPTQGSPLPLTPQKKSRRRLWILLSTIGALLIVLIVVCGIIVYIVSSSSQNPAKGTLDIYCNALQRGDYQSAFNQIASPNLQGIDEPSFAQFYASNRVSSCTPGSFKPLKSTTGADIPDNISVELRIVYASGRVENDALVMSKSSNSTWQIDLIIFPGNCTRLGGC